MSTLRCEIIPVTAFEQNCSLVWDTATMRGDHGVRRQRAIPRANPITELAVAFPAGWRKIPLVALAPCQDGTVSRLDLRQRQALQFAIGDFNQSCIGFVIVRFKTKRGA